MNPYSPVYYHVSKKQNLFNMVKEKVNLLPGWINLWGQLTLSFYSLLLPSYFILKVFPLIFEAAFTITAA